MLEIGDKSNRISQMSTADAIVRNDEVVGSIPTSSTIFSSTYKPSVVQSCHTLSQKIRLAGVCCLTLHADLTTDLCCEN